MCAWERKLHDEERNHRGLGAETIGNQLGPVPYGLHRRRKSETLRAQYIDVRELRHGFLKYIVFNYLNGY